MGAVIDQLHAAARDNLYKYVDLAEEWQQRCTSAGNDPLEVVGLALSIHLKAVMSDDQSRALFVMALMELARLRTPLDLPPVD